MPQILTALIHMQSQLLLDVCSLWRKLDVLDVNVLPPLLSLCMNTPPLPGQPSTVMLVHGQNTVLPKLACLWSHISVLMRREAKLIKAACLQNHFLRLVASQQITQFQHSSEAPTQLIYNKCSIVSEVLENSSAFTTSVKLRHNQGTE